MGESGLGSRPICFCLLKSKKHCLELGPESTFSPFVSLAGHAMIMEILSASFVLGGGGEAVNMQHQKVGDGCVGT